jgi:hypothetical protein
MALTPLDPSDPPWVKLAHVLTELRYTQRQSAMLLNVSWEELPKILSGELLPSYTVRLRVSTLAEQVGIRIPPLEWLKIRSEILADLAEHEPPPLDIAEAQIERNAKAKSRGKRK